MSNAMDVDPSTPVELTSESGAGADASSEEAVRGDVENELRRMQQAAQFNPPSGLGTSEVMFDPGSNYGISSPSTEAPELSRAVEEDQVSVFHDRDRTPSVVRMSRTIEDLYASHPRIGDGSFFLRVERKKPSTWAGVPISGFLTDLHEQISMNDFVDRFGGGHYLVHVMGPSGSGLDIEGSYRLRSIDSIKIEIPGQPKAISASSPEGDMFGKGYPQMVSVPGTVSDPVRLKEMELQQRERERMAAERNTLAERLMNTSAVDPAIVAQIREASERRADDARVANQETINDLRRQLQRREEIVDEKDKLVQDLRQKVVDIQTESANRLRDEETRQIRELRERHEQEVGRIKDEHARALAQLQTSHQQMISEVNIRHNEERRTLETVSERDRERSREDSSRRENQMTNDFKMQMETLRTGYESRISEADRSHKREMDALRDQRDREIASIQSSESMKSALTENSAKLQVSLLEGELNRSRSENEQLKRENLSLRDKTFKDPVQAISEASQLMDLVGGGRGAEEGEGDWKKGVFQVIKGLSDKLPEAAAAFANARATNQQAHAQVEAQEQMRRQRMMSPPPGMQVAQMGPAPGSYPQQQQQQQPRRVMQNTRIPAPSWGKSMGTPPAPGQPIGVPNVVGGPIMQEPVPMKPTYIGNQPQKRPAPPPATGRPIEISAPMGFDEPLNQQPVQAVQEQMTQAHQQESTTVAGVEITQESVVQFADELDTAIRSGLITPRQFAEAFIERGGVDLARTIVNSVDPDTIADQITLLPSGKDSAIVTGEGRQYVRDLWNEVKKITG